MPAIALSTTLSLAGCATDNAFRDAAIATAVAEETGAAAGGLVEGERAVGRDLPAYPPGCRRTHASGVKPGDRLDVASLKADTALGNANAQITACARWYDKVRDGFMNDKDGAAAD